ncbi:hypothetical protein BH11PSE7_BH11PSE7_37610 [soil metagenome]
MLKKEVARGAGGWIVIMDSITRLVPGDTGAIVVSASHGGASSAEYALEVPLRAAFFNDAGFGKDNAGAAALALLQARGVAAGVVAHTSARIGDAQDMWDHGVVSAVNERAAAMGAHGGVPLRDCLLAFVTNFKRPL